MNNSRMTTPWASSYAAVGARASAPHQVSALSQGRYRPHALLGRATRMNQWTFFNKKIEALKHQAASGSAPATLVKETTSGRNRGPKPKKASSDDEPAAPIMASQEYQPQQVLTGKFMPMNEVVQTVAALPSSMDANGEV
ncbi:hypothetical protein FOMG_00217 [Fusarium oxysporum f. sp. melonis 26406]|uniref:Uncharacterized protein n=1 Tax=Fusarium oxysporum f. sp. melonis 26406 TaxID=1089452 RepID=X0AS22_FUSOX|nr:hypothetical protein FOMG_00217 [Fusarium oxysporum f. sp. melonis 26406]